MGFLSLRVPGGKPDDDNAGGRDSPIGSVDFQPPAKPRDRLHFPTYNPVPLPQGATGRFCRSMLSSGHGYALPEAQGDLDPPAHRERGIGIGDVGYILESGHFGYQFNIFYPPDDPIQPPVADMPRKFVPIQPPLSGWEVRTSTNHFPPGAAFASEGVEVTQLSESPLKIRFSTSAREGAAMVLPLGASRADLVDTAKLYDYIKEHAVDWYQHRNAYGGTGDNLGFPPGMNGTLFLITGSDKARSFARASFPFRPTNLDAQTHEFIFDEGEREDGFWVYQKGQISMSSRTEEESEGLHAVFIRGISIALGPAAWWHHLPIIPGPDFPYFANPLGSLDGSQTWIAQHLDRIRPPRDNYLSTEIQIPFHPSMILLQILLKVAPSAQVALVHDSVWCSLINGRNPTHPELVALVHRILDGYDISLQHEIVTFVQLPKENKDQATPIGRMLNTYAPSLYQWATRSTFQRKASRVVGRILRRPRIP